MLNELLVQSELRKRLIDHINGKSLNSIRTTINSVVFDKFVELNRQFQNINDLDIEDIKRIGNWIKKIEEECKLTDEEDEDSFTLSYNTLNDFIKGQRDPDIRTLHIICIYLDYYGWYHFLRESNSAEKISIESHYKKDNIPKVLTVRLPQVRQDQIVGRTEDIEDLRKRLFDNNQVVLVNGMGGIGKTTVAAVYEDKYKDTYNHIAWITQNSGDFANDLISTPNLLSVLKIKTVDKTADQLFNETITALDSIEGSPNLMIIDNADEKLAKYFDKLPKKPKWHVLTTSREIIPYFDKKELGFLGEKDAIELYKINYERDDIDESVVKKIVQDLDYHTLTIEILAKTAKNRDQSPEYVLEFLEKDVEVGIKVKHSDVTIKKITSYLCSIFEKLSDLSEDNKWLLIQLSCLPAEFLTYKELRDLIKIDGNREIDLRRNLEILASKGWLLYDKGNDGYKLHRILIDVIGKSLNIKIETVQPLTTIISDALNIDHAKDNPIESFKWIPYGNALLYQLRYKESLLISQLQNNLALVLKNIGGRENLLKSIALLESAIDLAKNILGENNLDIARYRSNLSLVLLDLDTIGSLKRAHKLSAEAKMFAKNNLEDNNPIKAEIYNGLALGLQKLGGIRNLREARDLFSKTIKYADLSLGEDHYISGVYRSNLAMLLLDIDGEDNLIEAKTLLEEAINIHEEQLGEVHLTTAKRYNNLSTVLWKLSGNENLYKAKELLEKAIFIRQKLFLVDEDPELSIYQSNLSLILKDIGGKEELLQAEKVIREALLSTENSYGYHPKTSIRVNNLALILIERGGKENLQEAKDLLEKSIEMNELHSEESDSNIARSYFNYAIVLFRIDKKKNLFKVIKMFEKAKEIAINTLGRQHPDTLKIIGNLNKVRK